MIWRGSGGRSVARAVHPVHGAWVKQRFGSKSVILPRFWMLLQNWSHQTLDMGEHDVFEAQEFKLRKTYDPERLWRPVCGKGAHLVGLR